MVLACAFAKKDLRRIQIGFLFHQIVACDFLMEKITPANGLHYFIPLDKINSASTFLVPPKKSLTFFSRILLIC